MIRFVISNGHHYTVESLQQEAKAPAIDFVTYDELIRSRRVKWATYIFTDFDRLASFDLELAARIYVQMRDAGLKVLNNPAKVKIRDALLRSLHREGINDFDVYRGDDVPENMRFPVFIRKIRGHSHQCTDLLLTRNAVLDALASLVESGIPAQHLLIVEYAGEPIESNVYRKLAAVRVDSAICQLPAVHDTHWFVKTGPNFIAENHLYEEDAKTVQENPHAELLRKAFCLANIDYGRADFGLYRGRLQVFEINTNPHVLAPKAHPSSLRQKTMEFAWQQTLSSLRAIDSKPKEDVRLPHDNVLKNHRNRLAFLFRSRHVP